MFLQTQTRTHAEQVEEEEEKFQSARRYMYIWLVPRLAPTDCAMLVWLVGKKNEKKKKGWVDWWVGGKSVHSSGHPGNRCLQYEQEEGEGEGWRREGDGGERERGERGLALVPLVHLRLTRSRGGGGGGVWGEREEEANLVHRRKLSRQVVRTYRQAGRLTVCVCVCG